MTHALRQIDLATVLSVNNPQIDLKLQAYETSTRNFLKAVSNYKNRSISTISERRTNQAAEKKRIAEKSQAIESETNQCKVREIELVAGESSFAYCRLCNYLTSKLDLQREQEERKDAEVSVATFKRQLNSLHERCTAIDSELEQYRAIVGNLRRGTSWLYLQPLLSNQGSTEKQKERSTLGTHATHVFPDLDAYERRLACVIEGIEKDQLLVRFTRIDNANPDREFSFVIDISTQFYKSESQAPL